MVDLEILLADPLLQLLHPQLVLPIHRPDLLFLPLQHQAALDQVIQDLLALRIILFGYPQLPLHIRQFYLVLQPTVQGLLEHAISPLYLLLCAHSHQLFVIYFISLELLLQLPILALIERDL